MGTVVQFNNRSGTEKLPDEAKRALGKYRLEVMKRVEEMRKNPKAYTREERKRLSRDMEYAQLAYENNWNDEEFKANREAFDRKKDKERRESKERTVREIDIIYNGGKNLTEFEKRQTEKYMKDNPEDEAILTGLVNMISAGINDPENITDYAD